MQKLSFEKAFLVQRISENRKTHEQVYQEAKVTYRAKAEEALEARLRLVKSDGKFDLAFDLAVPFNHLEDYDLVLLMLKQCQENTVELTQEEYSQYVLDNWNWRRHFLTSNSRYSETAVSGCLASGY
jgi:hypothetical protein